MIDLYLAAVSAALIAFFSFFLASFLLLGLLTSVVHIMGLVFHSLFMIKGLLFGGTAA